MYIKERKRDDDGSPGQKSWAKMLLPGAENTQKLHAFLGSLFRHQLYVSPSLEVVGHWPTMVRGTKGSVSAEPEVEPCEPEDWAIPSQACSPQWRHPWPQHLAVEKALFKKSICLLGDPALMWQASTENTHNSEL